MCRSPFAEFFTFRTPGAKDSAWLTGVKRNMNTAWMRRACETGAELDHSQTPIYGKQVCSAKQPRLVHAPQFETMVDSATHFNVALLVYACAVFC